MKKTIMTVSIAITALILAGCTTKSVSRAYEADVDTTWAAVLKMSKDLVGREPMEVDREKGKIVTNLAFGEVRSERDTDTDISNQIVDVRRAIITVKAEGARTRVSVRVQQGSLSKPEEPPIINKKPAGVGITVFSSDIEWQNKFLDAVTAELSKG